MRLVFVHGSMSVAASLGEDSDIHEVVEVVDHCLRGIGFEPASIRRAFGEYRTPAEGDE